MKFYQLLKYLINEQFNSKDTYFSFEIISKTNNINIQATIEIDNPDLKELQEYIKKFSGKITSLKEFLGKDTYNKFLKNFKDFKEIKNLNNLKLIGNWTILDVKYDKDSNDLNIILDGYFKSNETNEPESEELEI